MRFHKLDLNLLVVLDALLTDRSITTTAERLHRTQPAVSASLRRLREFFGDELFVMAGREFLPTPVALALAQPVREALDHIQNVVIGKTSFDPSASSRHFRVIMSDFIAMTVFQKVVREVANIAPGITFEVVQFDDNFDAPLNRGEVDFLIFPDIFLSDRHPACHLFEEELVAVRCGSRPLEELTLSTFLSGRHVAAKFGKTRKPSIEEFLMNEVGLRREIDVVVPNFALLPHFVLGTDRIATMHRGLAEYFANLMPLKIESLPFSLPKVREALQWPQLNQNDAASLWLREIMVRAVSTHNA
ncbi:MAG: LysR family transcriptional regulator [Burkholderiaceae bacterium]|nr:LysR family transcriptional regulator [Burkholderiaceae bacterium]